MKTDVVYKGRRLNTLIPRMTDKMVKYMQQKKRGENTPKSVNMKSDLLYASKLTSACYTEARRCAAAAPISRGVPCSRCLKIKRRVGRCRGGEGRREIWRLELHTWQTWVPWLSNMSNPKRNTHQYLKSVPSSFVQTECEGQKIACERTAGCRAYAQM